MESHNLFDTFALEIKDRNLEIEKQKLFIESPILYSDILRLDMNKEYEEIIDL